MIDIDSSWSTQNSVFRSTYPDWQALDCEICQENEHVQNGTCVSCPRDTTTTGAFAPRPETSCDPIICGENKHVVNHTCVSCEFGSSNVAGDGASGQDTSCDCIEDYHVVDHTCVACPSGQSNLAGDNTSGQDTSCDCIEDYQVVNHTCVACPSGQSNLAGDDPSGQDTNCDCTEDYHVVDHTCLACTWCSSAKRENLNHTSHFNPNFVVISIRTPTHSVS